MLKKHFLMIIQDYNGHAEQLQSEIEKLRHKQVSVRNDLRGQGLDYFQAEEYLAVTEKKRVARKLLKLYYEIIYDLEEMLQKFFK